MLQDLDHRHAIDAPGYVLQDGGTPAPQESWWTAIPSRLPWVFGVLMFSATLILLWQQANRSPEKFTYVDAGGALSESAGALASITPGSASPHLGELQIDAAKMAGHALETLASINPGSASPHLGELQIDAAGHAIGTLAKANEFGIPEFDAALNAPFIASRIGIFQSHGLKGPGQLAIPEPVATIAPTRIAKQEPADSTPKTTRLSNTPIEYPDSSLQTNATTLITLNKATIRKGNATSNISIQPAGGAATRSYKKARLLLDKGQTNEAKTELQRTLVFDPGHKSAREILVALLLQRGDELGAESLIDTGITYSPGHSPFTQLKARILSSRGETEAAIEIMESVAPNRRYRIAHYTMLAALYQKSGNHELAITRYLALIESDPQESTLWSGLAISLDSQGQYKAALKAYQQALEGRRLSIRLRQYARQRVLAIKRTNGGENS